MTKLALVFIIFSLSLLVLRKGKKERGECVICGKDVFDPKIIEGKALCKKHVELFKSGQWESFTKGHASPHDPEYGVRLYEFKRLLNSHKLSSYIQADYFQEGEEIKTEMVLMVLKEDLEKAEALSRSWEKI